MTTLLSQQKSFTWKVFLLQQLDSQDKSHPGSNLNGLLERMTIVSLRKTRPSLVTCLFRGKMNEPGACMMQTFARLCIRLRNFARESACVSVRVCVRAWMSAWTCSAVLDIYTELNDSHHVILPFRWRGLGEDKDLALCQGSSKRTVGTDR